MRRKTKYKFRGPRLKLRDNAVSHSNRSTSVICGPKVVLIGIGDVLMWIL